MRAAAGLMALGLLFGLAGCTVTAVSGQEDPRPNNTCKSDADCGHAHCLDGLCQTLNGELETVLISVNPPSQSAVAHLTYQTSLEKVPTAGGQADITLLGPSHVTGTLSLPKGVTCYPTFIDADPKNPTLGAIDRKTLPVTATFALKQPLRGLPQQVYFASASGAKDQNTQGSLFYELRVPGGDYDVYLVPPPNQRPDCAVPPQLYRGIPIRAEAVDLPLVAAPVSPFSLTIAWPRPGPGPGLEGWVVDIVEPVGGNAISTAVTLGAPADPTGTSQTVDYVADLLYSPVTETATDASAPTSDLVRLRPPAGLVAPTIVLDRSGLALFGQSAVRFPGFTHYPAPVHVHGSLARLQDSAPVSGFLTIMSTEIADVEDGIFASFRTTTTVGDDGVVDVVLPPGTYRVQAVPAAVDMAPPASGALAALEVSWQVPASPTSQFGKLIELPLSSVLSGQSRVAGSQVRAVPSPVIVSPFAQSFGREPFKPRATSALVDDTGRFVVQADPGKFNISMQAPENLGFAWFVRPGFDVGLGSQDLGRLALPKPSAVSGTVRISSDGSDAVLPSAAVQAYAYLDANLAYTRDPKQAVSVVQVAETRADENGFFRLLLPESIDAPK